MGIWIIKERHLFYSNRFCILLQYLDFSLLCSDSFIFIYLIFILQLNKLPIYNTIRHWVYLYFSLSQFYTTVSQGRLIYICIPHVAKVYYIVLQLISCSYMCMYMFQVWEWRINVKYNKHLETICLKIIHF